MVSVSNYQFDVPLGSQHDVWVQVHPVEHGFNSDQKSSIVTDEFVTSFVGPINMELLF
jgi:hypothetical protein